MTADRSERPPAPEGAGDRGPRMVRPYGDATDDGQVQLSFTLPVPSDLRAEAAARELARSMGMVDPRVVERRAVGPGFTFFIVYGAVEHAVDLDAVIVQDRPYPLLDHGEVDRRVLVALGRPAVVLGAALGTDAHTVGLDAILSPKGWAGDKGLESYDAFTVVNLRAQVPPEELADRAVAEGADAVLVSQTVSQRRAHLHHLEAFAQEVARRGIRDRFVMVAGGAGLDPAVAAALGYDRVFGRGTTPSDVASYLAWVLAERASPP